MDILRDLKLPAALVISTAILSFFGGVVALVLWGHQSLTGVSTFIGAVLAALVLYRQGEQRKQADRVEANTNGVNAALQARLGDKDQQLIEMATKHAREVAQLTAQLPPGTPLPTSLTDEPEQVNSGPLARRLPPRP